MGGLRFQQAFGRLTRAWDGQLYGDSLRSNELGLYSKTGKCSGEELVVRHNRDLVRKRVTTIVRAGMIVDSIVARDKRPSGVGGPIGS